MDFWKSLENLAFVTGVFCGATEGRDYITIEDAEQSIREWRKEGIEVPETLDGECFANMWNTFVMEEEKEASL